MNPSAPTRSAANAIASLLAPACPSAMFAATLPDISAGCWGTQAICRRQASMAIESSGRPPASIRPSLGSTNRSSSASSELLPAPLAPATAIRSPGAMVSDTPSSAGRSRPG